MRRLAARKWDRLHSRGLGTRPSAEAAYTQAYARTKPGEHVLEVAYGGRSLLPWRERGAAEVHGLDFSTGTAKQPEGIKTAVCDIVRERLPYKENRFDRVVAIDLLTAYPLEEIESVLSKLHAVAKPGGEVVFTVRAPTAETMGRNNASLFMAKGVYLARGHEFTPSGLFEPRVQMPEVARMLKKIAPKAEFEISWLGHDPKNAKDEPQFLVVLKKR